jgi:hypothetical protein
MSTSPTVAFYNHTARRFADGSNSPSDTYKVALYTAATFNASQTTLASVTKTEVANANGYTTGGNALTNVSLVTASTNGATFDADDVIWTPSGGSISASFAILYNDTDADDPPLVFINFNGSRSADNGTNFSIIWNSSGIFSWIVSS